MVRKQFLSQFFTCVQISLSLKKIPRKMKKKKFPIDTNNGETPYSNDRPVPQLSIQGKYVHPAI